MESLRFFGLALGMFVAVFFGMKWYLTVEPLKPDARLPVFHRVDTNDPRYQLEQSSVSDGDAVRDRLRADLLDYAQSLDRDPCNHTLRTHYIEAADNYARAWTSIVPCLRTRTCGQSNSQKLDLAAHAFGTPLDHRVREAMRKLHAKVVFKLGDFPNDTAPLVAELAADGAINPRATRTTGNGPVNAQTAAQAGRGLPDFRTEFGGPAPVCG